MRRVILLIGLIILGLFLVVKPPLFSNAERGNHPLELAAPAGDRPTHINPSGETVLPNGRLITPEGVQVTVEPHPYGMVLSPDGNLLVTANTGTWPFSISIVSALDAPAPDVQQIPHGYPLKHSDVEPSSVYMGLAIAGDNRTAYVSEGDTGKIDVYDLQIGQRSQVILLDSEFNGKLYRHSFSGALALSPDGKLLYALDLAHFELVGIETRGGGIVWRVGVGRLPFAVAVSPQGDRVYVSNVGTFQYSVVPGFDETRAGRQGWILRPSHRGPRRRRMARSLPGKKYPAWATPTCRSQIRFSSLMQRAPPQQFWPESARAWRSGISPWAGRVPARWWRGILASMFRTPRRTASVFWTQKGAVSLPPSGWSLLRAWADCEGFCPSASP